MAQIRKGTTYATGDQVTAANLNALADNAILLPGAVTEQTAGTLNPTDKLLAADSALKTLTVAQVQAGLVKSDGSVAMTNHLQLASSSPPDALTAASKGYVDAQVSTSIANAISSATSTIVAIAAPAGCVMAWPGSVPPSGWIECNGQASPTSALVAIVGSNVPDLRGQFIRGWDHGAGVDSGRSLLSYQADGLREHYHQQRRDDNTGAAGSSSGNPDANWGNVEYGLTSNVRDASNVPIGISETRPKNKAFMFIIKT